jgi:DNA invertase Pin-like site-specific DNA recombinase
MTAYAYLRKSVVRQDDPTNSAEAQEAAVRALAARHGDAARLVLLSDWDKSGKLGREKRPGYDALWSAIEAGTATAVYSYSMSRLARSVAELLRLFETCADRHIPIRLDKDVVDTSTASGQMVATILASVAAFEANVAGERLRSAMAAKSARGERIGTAPFYGDGAGDDAAAVLAAFREAGSYSGAARLLNARNVKPRGSKRGWWPSSVSVVVKRLDPSVPALRPSRGYNAGGSDFTLARLLRCPTCDTLLTGTRDRREIIRPRAWPPSRHPKDVDVLGPGRVRYSCRLGCVTPHPRVSVSEHLILAAIKAEVAHLRTPAEVETTEGDAEKRGELEARRLRVVDMFEAGIIDRTDRDRRIGAVTEAMAKLDDRRVTLALDVERIDWTKPPRVLNALLRAVFERIDLDPETFQPQPDGYLWRVPEWRA